MTKHRSCQNLQSLAKQQAALDCVKGAKLKLFLDVLAICTRCSTCNALRARCSRGCQVQHVYTTMNGCCTRRRFQWAVGGRRPISARLRRKGWAQGGLLWSNRGFRVFQVNVTLTAYSRVWQRGSLPHPDVEGRPTGLCGSPQKKGSVSVPHGSAGVAAVDPLHPKYLRGSSLKPVVPLVDQFTASGHLTARASATRRVFGGVRRRSTNKNGGCGVLYRARPFRLKS